MLSTHVNKSLIKYSKFINLHNYIELENCEFLSFDTESSRIPNNLEMEHVWAWAVGNTYNDYVVYGNSLKEFIEFSNQLIEDTFLVMKPKVKEKRRLLNIKMFVHNLSWDIEFFKYYLLEKNYEYFRKEINEITGKVSNKGIEKKSFSIAENKNQVYSCDIATEKTYKVGRCELPVLISMFDSLKIVPQTLNDIGTKVIDIEEMFYKQSETFDYETPREHNHKLSQLERNYLYNDVYILKEFIKQFYLPLNTNMKTASGIAFEMYIKTAFKSDDMKNAYELFEEHYPIQFNPQIKAIIKASYSGGWTQSNRKTTGVKILTNKALSIDINSSYPSTVKFKPLPYGDPKLYKGDPVYTDEYKNAILTICFDGFKNKNEDNQLGEFKCLSINKDIFKVTGNEYIATNIKDNKCLGYGNNKSSKYLYKISIWDFELHNILENLDLYIAHKEYDDILECYNINTGIEKGYHIESSLVYKMETGFFGEAVDLCMIEKNKGKELNNTCMELSGKLKANSFYGKMASSVERDIRDLKINDKGLSEFKSDNRVYETPKKYYPSFASCVTAWSRVNLRTTLYKCGYNNVLYFDTDSLYTTLNYEQLKDLDIDLHPTKLGAWDIEKEYSWFKSIGAKKYILHGKSYGKAHELKCICKCAGLPKEVRDNIQEDDFYLGKTFTGKKAKKRVKGGYRIVEGDYTLNNHIFN